MAQRKAKAAVKRKPPISRKKVAKAASRGSSAARRRSTSRARGETSGQETLQAQGIEAMPPEPKGSAPFNTETKWKFLSTLRRTGNVTRSAWNAGWQRTASYAYRLQNKEFAAEWDDALECATDALEAEARRRGHEGYIEPVHYKGVRVDTIVKYSDRMLEILLKGHRKERFAERHEVTGKGGRPIETVAAQVVIPSDPAAAAAVYRALVEGSSPQDQPETTQENAQGPAIAMQGQALTEQPGSKQEDQESI